MVYPPSVPHLERSTTLTLYPMNLTDTLSMLKNSCKIMAKDLVRTRRYISKFYGMKTQLQAVSLRIQTMRSNQQMAEAMKGATKVRLVPLSKGRGDIDDGAAGHVDDVPSGEPPANSTHLARL
jgi:hypothetical protein